MQKKSVSLNLHLLEEGGTARMVLLDGGALLVDFENEEAPPVRVVGFNTRGAHNDRLVALVERESNNFGGSVHALDVLIGVQEKQLYDKLLLLRSEARKIAILGQSIRNAKRMRAQLAASGEIKK